MYKDVIFATFLVLPPAVPPVSPLIHAIIVG